jgi:hypothetical protein
VVLLRRPCGTHGAGPATSRFKPRLHRHGIMRTFLSSCAARSLRSWSARATSSWLIPVWPTMRSGASARGDRPVPRPAEHGRRAHAFREPLQTSQMLSELMVVLRYWPIAACRDRIRNISETGEPPKASQILASARMI